MGHVSLQKELIESGYPHDDTGRWIDTSYFRYTVKITGKIALMELQSRLNTISGMATEKLAEVVEAYRVEEVQRDHDLRYQTVLWEDDMVKYRALPWYKRWFRNPPEQPRLVPVSDKLKEQLRKYTELTEAIDKALDDLFALDYQFGVYVKISDNYVPFEHRIMMTRPELMDIELITKRQQ